MSLTLKAFLSHRYQSPAVNTYFHEVFSEVADCSSTSIGARAPPT